MKKIEVFITEDPDQWVMEEVEDELYSALSNHFSSWDFTITTWDVKE